MTVASPARAHDRQLLLVVSDAQEDVPAGVSGRDGDDDAPIGLSRGSHDFGVVLNDRPDRLRRPDARRVGERQQRHAPRRRRAVVPVTRVVDGGQQRRALPGRDDRNRADLVGQAPSRRREDPRPPGAEVDARDEHLVSARSCDEYRPVGELRDGIDAVDLEAGGGQDQRGGLSAGRVETAQTGRRAKATTRVVAPAGGDEQRVVGAVLVVHP